MQNSYGECEEDEFMVGPLDVTANQDVVQDDPSQVIKTHLPNLPSDLALNQYKFPTYAKLEDVLGPGAAAVPNPYCHHNRHDSHHPSNPDNRQPDHTVGVLQVVQASGDGNGDDDDSDFEMPFKRVGLDHGNPVKECGSLHDEEDHDASMLHRSSPQTTDVPSYPTSIITPKIKHVLDNFSARLSDGEGSDADGENEYAEQSNKPHQVHEVQQTEPFPQLQPQQSPPPPRPHEEPIPQTALDHNIRRHARARTYPLRLHAFPTHNKNPPQDQSAGLLQPAPPRSDTSMQNAHISPHHLAPRFTGFAHLPPQTSEPLDRRPLIPLHLQPHPGHPRPLPPSYPQPHPHFVPNPAPLPLPLPRRPSNPPPTIDPTQDKFYHELKSKLWKLAQELENLQPGRVERSTSPPTPDFDEVNEEAIEPEGSDDDELYDNYDDEGGANSLHGSDVEDIVDWVKRKEVLEGLQRWRSEGKGRKAARERAERVHASWLKQPD